MGLRTKYRNQLFHSIRESGLNLEAFQLIENKNDTLTIYYTGTPFTFEISNSEESYEIFFYRCVFYAPNTQVSDWYPANRPKDLFSSFNSWLNNDIKSYLEDLNEPDLWSEFKKGNKILNIDTIDFNDKSFFLQSEKQQIEVAIKQFKLLIRESLNPTEAEEGLIIDRLDYLIDASKRLNKFDWKSLSISTLLSITIALSFDTQKGQLLFNLFKKVFNTLTLLSN